MFTKVVSWKIQSTKMENPNKKNASCVNGNDNAPFLQIEVECSKEQQLKIEKFLQSINVKFILK